jgi:hypothetical protein
LDSQANGARLRIHFPPGEDLEAGARRRSGVKQEGDVMRSWEHFAVKFGLLLSIVLIAATSAPAAETPPEALVKARAAFATAIAAKDVKAAEALTSFPLKNVVTSAPRTISQAGFARQFEIYAQMADCLQSAPLEYVPGGGGRPKSWIVNCNGNIVYFAFKQGRWLHSEYENVNE